MSHNVQSSPTNINSFLLLFFVCFVLLLCKCRKSQQNLPNTENGTDLLQECALSLDRKQRFMLFGKEELLWFPSPLPLVTLLWHMGRFKALLTADDAWAPVSRQRPETLFPVHRETCLKGESKQRCKSAYTGNMYTFFCLQVLFGGSINIYAKEILYCFVFCFKFALHWALPYWFLMTNEQKKVGLSHIW